RLDQLLDPGFEAPVTLLLGGPERRELADCHPAGVPFLHDLIELEPEVRDRLRGAGRRPASEQPADQGANNERDQCHDDYACGHAWVSHPEQKENLTSNSLA